VREAGVDLVVFSIHWGPNMRQVPSPEFVAFAHGVERIELIPLLISYMQVNRATGAAFDEIAERMRSLSAAMGTDIEQEGDRLVIEVGE